MMPHIPGDSLRLDNIGAVQTDSDFVTLKGAGVIESSKLLPFHSIQRFTDLVPRKQALVLLFPVAENHMC